MSVTLVIQVLVVVVTATVAGMFRHVVGPGRKRGRIMLAGTLGGMSFGVLVAHFLSPWLHIDVSVICAFLGMQLGWGVCWLFARQIPREAD